MANNPSYSTNLGLTLQPEFDQKEHPAIWADLLRIRNALGVLQSALDTYTGALSVEAALVTLTPASQSVQIGRTARIYIKADVAVTYGTVCDLAPDGSLVKAVKAKATVTFAPTKAICTVPAGLAAGAFGEFYLLGAIPGYGGLLTPGALYYTSDTAGQMTITKPATVGYMQQVVGYALDDSTLYFNPQLNWSIA